MGLSFPFFLSNLNLYNFYLLSNVLNVYTWLDVRIKRVIIQNLYNMFINKCYISLRHESKLPCRGQRTRTNASTRKRIKVVVIEKKK